MSKCQKNTTRITTPLDHKYIFNNNNNKDGERSLLPLLFLNITVVLDAHLFLIQLFSLALGHFNTVFFHPLTSGNYKS